MIRVEEAPEPPEFDQRVRLPGLDAIAELVGEKPQNPRPGPRREKIAERREAIPPAKFPTFWTRVLPEMLSRYQRICAYLSLYIEHGTGGASIDHIVPKSRTWDQVYEWSNYRLACALMNSRKAATDVVLDPFEIQEDWFALDFVEYQVKVGPGATGEDAQQVQATIEQLKLNDQQCCRAREEYVEGYLSADPLPFSYVQRRAPFLAHELKRQGLLRSSDF